MTQQQHNIAQGFLPWTKALAHEIPNVFESARGRVSPNINKRNTHTHTLQHSAWGVCLFVRCVCVTQCLHTHTHTCKRLPATHSCSPLAKPTWWSFLLYLSFESSHERTRASVLISRVKHDYDLLMLKLRSLVDIFHSFSQRWEFSCIAPHGINIFISACVSAFKTFPPAVWKIFLISHPYGAQKSP